MTDDHLVDARRQWVLDLLDSKDYADRQWVLGVVERVDKVYQAQIRELEKQKEVMEQQLAMLVQGYAELAAMSQTILKTHLPNVDEEEFQRVYKENAKQMIQVFVDGLQQAQTQKPRFHPGAAPAQPDPDTDS